MRVAFITPEYVTESNFDGGLANYIHRVSLALLQLGHEPVVIVASDRNEHFVRDGVDVYRVESRSRWLDILNKLTYGCLLPPLLCVRRSFLLNRRLREIHGRRPFDIVQYSSYTAAGLLRPKDVPHCMRLSSFEPMMRDAYEKPLNWPQRMLERLELLAIKRADSVFGPSHLVNEAVEARIKRKIKTIETPFVWDVLETDSRPYKDMLEGKKYLLFFGTIGLLKGVWEISEIINPLLLENPDLYFVFAGKNAVLNGRPMMDYLWEKAGPARGRVIYMGKLHHSHLYPVINGAFAVVLPTRVDNFPNTCIEAFAHKKVVIGTKGTSSEQLIDDGKNGFLCEIKDPKGLLGVIEKVLSLSESERKAIGEHAFERLDSLKPSIVVEKLIAYYRGVIEKRKK